MAYSIHRIYYSMALITWDAYWIAKLSIEGDQGGTGHTGVHDYDTKMCTYQILSIPSQKQYRYNRM